MDLLTRRASDETLFRVQLNPDILYSSLADHTDSRFDVDSNETWTFIRDCFTTKTKHIPKQYLLYEKQELPDLEKLIILGDADICLE